MKLLSVDHSCENASLSHSEVLLRSKRPFGSIRTTGRGAFRLVPVRFYAKPMYTYVCIIYVCTGRLGSFAPNFPPPRRGLLCTLTLNAKLVQPFDCCRKNTNTQGRDVSVTDFLLYKR